MKSLGYLLLVVTIISGGFKRLSAQSFEAVKKENTTKSNHISVSTNSKNLDQKTKFNSFSSETTNKNRLVSRNSMSNPSIKLFQEGNFIFSYGLGYGGITQLFYNLGFSRDPFKTGHVTLHTISGVVAIDYFFGPYFDIGADFMIGGNLNRKVTEGDTGILLMMMGFRGFIHYPFPTIDLYGGISLGLALTHQTFTPNEGDNPKSASNTRSTLGWNLRFGSRFKITSQHGIFIEAGFPLPWISLGGYYQIK